MPTPILVAAFGLIAVAAALVSWRKPLVGLTVLILLLPLHSGFIHVLDNLLGLRPIVVTAAGAWKEGILVGLVAAALPAAMRRGSVSPATLLALVLLATVALRGAIDLATGADPLQVLYGGRALGEPFVAFVAVGLLDPGMRWLRGIAPALLAVMGVVALFGIIQPAFGPGFYDVFFHRPGESLASAYTANWLGEPHLRAVSTFEGPNEFGLALVIVLMVVALPALLASPSPAVALAVGLMLAALISAISRSAWVGLAVGSAVALVAGWRLWRASGRELTRPLLRPRILVPILVPLVASLAVFLISGGIEFVADTVTGEDRSASARPGSILSGLSAFVSEPLGMGLGTAGPRSLDFDPSAVQTENWYLVYGIQLGWLALAVLIALLGFVAIQLIRVARRTPAGEDADSRWERLTELGLSGAFLGALVGALVIPALLDLPASLTLWALVATILAASDRVRSAQPAPRTVEATT